MSLILGLGFKMVPRWLKMAQVAQDNPKLAQKESQDSPQMGQVWPRWAKIAPKLLQQSPNIAQDRPKMSQDGQDGPTEPFKEPLSALFKPASGVVGLLPLLRLPTIFLLCQSLVSGTASNKLENNLLLSLRLGESARHLIAVAAPVSGCLGRSLALSSLCFALPSLYFCIAFVLPSLSRFLSNGGAPLSYGYLPYKSR